MCRSCGSRTLTRKDNITIEFSRTPDLLSASHLLRRFLGLGHLVNGWQLAKYHFTHAKAGCVQFEDLAEGSKKPEAAVRRETGDQNVSIYSCWRSVRHGNSLGPFVGPQTGRLANDAQLGQTINVVRTRRK